MTSTQFFFKHAGYAYDPKSETKIQGRWRGARALASAEAWAHAHHGVEFEWQYDEEPYELGDGEQQPSEVLGCTLTIHGEHRASLWGIADPSREYRRVIEAELAYEAMPTVQDLELNACIA